MTILGALLLGFVVDVALVGGIRHHHAQEQAYAELRGQLANATAPVGPLDWQGHLLPAGAPVAVLDIPAIGVHEVVVEGSTSGVLMKGPGHRTDTVLPGQAGAAVIYGRRSAYGGPFGRLAELGPGQTITVTTGQGTNTFRTLAVRRAGDPQPAPLLAGHGRLTLATAGGPRFVPSGVVRVDAELVSAVQPTPAGRPAVSSSGQAMAGDPNAWVPVVLWGELLVVAVVLFAWTRRRWGHWQSWVIGVPALGLLGLTVADQAARLLPNLM